MGIIKLFKVIFSEVKEDADDEEFKGLKGIKGITQSKETGDI